jgi:predicted Zn finger-like uncharacterized protein
VICFRANPMNISCDRCGTRFRLPEGKIPGAGAKTSCPRCGNSLTVRAPSPPPPTAGATSQRYFVRLRDGRPLGSFADRQIRSMLDQGSLDGDEEVSPDGVTWFSLRSVPELQGSRPAAPGEEEGVDPLAGIDDDEPGATDLPAPKAAPPPLPRPGSRGTPKAGFDDADLLAPKVAPISHGPSVGPSVDLGLDLPAPKAAPSGRPASAPPPGRPPSAPPSGPAAGRSASRGGTRDLELDLDDAEYAGDAESGLPETHAPQRAAATLDLDLELPAASLSAGGSAGRVELDAVELRPQPAPVETPVEIGSHGKPVSLDSVELEPAAAPAAARARSRQAQEDERPKPRANKWILVGGLTIVVLCGGVAAGLFTDYGFFGYDLITGVPAWERSGAAELARRGQGEITDDTPESYRRAVDLFSQALERTPSFMEARALRAQALLAQAYRHGAEPGSIERARADLNALVDARGPAVLERDKARGLELLAAGREGEAVDILKPLADKAPNDGLAQTYLGWALIAARRPADAEQVLDRAVALNPASDGASMALGLARFAQGKTATAIPELEKVLRRSPGHLAAALTLGEIAWREGDIAQATQRLDPVLKTGTAQQRSRANAVMGWIAKSAGKLNEAEQRFSSAVDQDPKNTLALTGLGVLLYAAGRPNEALAKCAIARGIEREDPEAALCVARSLIHMGRHLDARLEVEDVAKRWPQNAEARYLLGRIEEAMEHWDQAEQQYRDAMGVDNKFFDAYAALAQVYLRQGKTADAFAALKQAESEMGQTAAVLNATGEAYVFGKDYPHAMASFRAAIQKDPAYNVARFNLASTLRDQGHLQEAREQYEATMAMAQNLPGLAESLGRLYLQLGETEKAVAEFDVALKAEGPTIELRLAAAEVYLAAARPDRAKDLAESILKDWPDQPDALSVLGRALRDQGDLEGGIEKLRRAISLKDRPSYEAALGEAHERAGRSDMAGQFYDKALQLDPSMVEVRIRRARLRLGGGQVREALDDLREVVRQKRRADALTLMGDCYVEMRQSGPAARAYQDAIKVDANFADAYYKLGRTDHDEGRSAQAIAHLRRALEAGMEKAPWTADAHLLLGYAYKQTRQRNEAVEQFKRYLELSPSDAPDRDEVKRELRFLGVEAG